MFIIDTTGSEGDSLQAYINAAYALPMFNPDTIILMPGTYHLAINNDTGLIMRDSVIVMGLTALQCTLSGISQDLSDSANHVLYFGNLGNCYSGVKYVTIANCNTTEHGAGIFIDNSSPFIDSCIIQNNITSQYGGGIYIANNSSPNIIGNIIYNNKASRGAGIYVYDQSNPLIRDNTISFDTASTSGAGLFVYSSSPRIINNDIYSNYSESEYGGGIAILNSEPMIDSCSINLNIANSTFGGGIFAYMSTCSIINSDISGNYADSSGGGIFLHTDSTSYIYNNTISNNVSNFGAGIGISNTYNSIIDSNSITDNNATVGGGIMIGFDSYAEIKRNTIKDNSSSQAGGGIALYEDCSPLITDNIISNNSTIMYGGGIFMDDHCDPIITGNTFSSNSTSFYGGGIFAQFYSDPIIENNLISKNSTLNYGGGVFIYDYSDPTLNNNEIVYNTSRDGGGGIFVYSDASATLNNNLIYHNSANNGGGGLVAVDNVIVNINKCIFAGNTAASGGAIYDTLNTLITIDSSLIIDNGSIVSLLSGFAHIATNAGTPFTITNSNIYYNTFQSDTELINFSTDTLQCQDNFWHYTDSIDIANTIYGLIDFTPFASTFISDVPGEPLSIDSVRVYLDTLYSVVTDTLNNPGTLYVSIYGQDRLPALKEAAIGILKSGIYLNGIAVALIETDSNSGIYHGSVNIAETTGTDNIRNDDILNVLRVNDIIDTIRISANTDSSSYWLVGYKTILSSINENNLIIPNLFLNVPSVINRNSSISYQIPSKQFVQIDVIDISGRIVSVLANSIKESGIYSIDYSKFNMNKSGIFFIRMTTTNNTLTKKTIIF